MLPLCYIFKFHKVPYHIYADDTQLYMSIKPGFKSLSDLLACINGIKSWMGDNFLQLNENKTEVILFGSPHLVNALSSSLGPLQANIRTHIKNLGVVFDSELKFDKQINYVESAIFFKLRGLRKLKSLLSFGDLETVIHAFISTRLDYCNALYDGVNQFSLSRLQLVQNAAAHFLMGEKKREHITPILVHLHWLPVQFRIEYKVLTFVFKTLHGLAPVYISDLICPYSPRRSRRSSSENLLTVPLSRLKSKGDRAFSVLAPKLWNSLLPSVRLLSSLSGFKSSLKTYLFSQAYS